MEKNFIIMFRKVFKVNYKNMQSKNEGFYLKILKFFKIKFLCDLNNVTAILP